MVVEQLWRNYMTILPSVFIRSAASALCMTLVGHCIFYSSWGLWNESRLMCAQVPWLLLVSAVCVCVCASGWGCLSSLRGWLMDQRRIAWTGAHDWYADRIWGAACQPPTLATPTWHLLQHVKQRSKKIQRALTGGEDGERGSEVRREWKSVERIGWVSPGEG